MAVVGDPSLVGDGNFVLTSTGTGVHAEKVFPNGLILSKDFELSSNYLVNASVTWRNPTEQAVTLPTQQLVVGTATPMDADDVNPLWGAMWYDGANYLANPVMYFNTNTTTFFGMWHRTPTLDYDAGNSNVLWAAVYNQYFRAAGDAAGAGVWKMHGDTGDAPKISGYERGRNTWPRRRDACKPRWCIRP